MISTTSIIQVNAYNSIVHIPILETDTANTVHVVILDDLTLTCFQPRPLPHTPRQQQDSLGRRPSAASSHYSDSAGSGSEVSFPNVGRLRRRFHDLLDDAFSLLNGQRPGDKVTPLTTPSPPRRGRARSAALYFR